MDVVADVELPYPFQVNTWVGIWKVRSWEPRFPGLSDPEIWVPGAPFCVRVFLSPIVFILKKKQLGGGWAAASLVLLGPAQIVADSTPHQVWEWSAGPNSETKIFN